MLKTIIIKFEDIYIPASRKAEHDPAKVDAIVDEMMEGNKQRPVKVRQGKGRYVLTEGINRLEACKIVGDTGIEAYIVQAQKH